MEKLLKLLRQFFYKVRLIARPAYELYLDLVYMIWILFLLFNSCLITRTPSIHRPTLSTLLISDNFASLSYLRRLGYPHQLYPFLSTWIFFTELIHLHRWLYPANSLLKFSLNLLVSLSRFSLKSILLYNYIIYWYNILIILLN